MARVAFVMEQTLGSITHYLNLRRAESEAPAGFSARWIPVEYRAGLLPWSVSGSAAARRAIGEAFPEVDALFVHTTTIALLSGGYFGRKPSILSTDATPLNKEDMRREYGLKAHTGLAARAKRAVHRSIYRRASGFVAWSDRPGERGRGLPRFLFVGGDFARKGGDLLLRVHRERLRGKAELDLVTTAPVEPEPGVRVHRGLRANSPELLRLYAECDAFVLPTRADCLPLVCLESLAAGLPLIATKVGGIPDCVREGETGHLVDPDDANALGDVLEALAADSARRERMSSAARAEAERRFDARKTARDLFEFVASRT
ncbi:MAG: glycosyltransferase [Deltaproteobacteria bacterium]|nr:MAG: glycosyltransferase [Deltaproteobacteria bacterium]